MPDTPHPLDRLLSPAEYGRWFVDAGLWQPYVRQVCAVHGLPCRVVENTTPGTFPTFIVDRRWVVKFFGPLFEGQRCFTVEQAAGQMLAQHPLLPAAPLAAAGRLLAGAATWDWPYLIYEYIEGESIGAVFERLNLAEKLAAAERLGGWVRGLHHLPLPPAGPFEQVWDGFTRFLARRRAGCGARQAAWGTLSPGLAVQVQDFIPLADDWYTPAEPPHLIHADLTADHLLGRSLPGGWQACALIDFGDARTGSLYYELAALQLSLFQGDRRLLAAFLAAYGFTPPPDFSRRALVFCLLHQFNVLGEQPELIAAASDLSGLADRLFAV